jgi:hypothetical protein
VLAHADRRDAALFRRFFAMRVEAFTVKYPVNFPMRPRKPFAARQKNFRAGIMRPNPASERDYRACIGANVTRSTQKTPALLCARSF